MPLLTIFQLQLAVNCITWRKPEYTCMQKITDLPFTKVTNKQHMKLYQVNHDIDGENQTHKNISLTCILVLFIHLSRLKINCITFYFNLADPAIYCCLYNHLFNFGIQYREERSILSSLEEMPKVHKTGLSLV
jgi:hypothetical protein